MSLLDEISGKDSCEPTALQQHRQIDLGQNKVSSESYAFARTFTGISYSRSLPDTQKLSKEHLNGCSRHYLGFIDVTLYSLKLFTITYAVIIKSNLIADCTARN